MELRDKIPLDKWRDIDEPYQSIAKAIMRQIYVLPRRLYAVYLPKSNAFVVIDKNVSLYIPSLVLPDRDHRMLVRNWFNLNPMRFATYRWTECDVEKGLEIGADPVDLLDSRIKERVVVVVNAVYFKEDKLDLTIDSSVDGESRGVWMSKRPVKEVLKRIRKGETQAIMDELIFDKSVSERYVDVRYDGSNFRNFVYANIPFLADSRIVLKRDCQCLWGKYLISLPSMDNLDFIEQQRELYQTEYNNPYSYLRTKLGIICREYTPTTDTNHNGSTA